MIKRIKRYFSGASVFIGITLSVMGLILSFKNDTNPVTIQGRWFWIPLFFMLLLFILLLYALYNQGKSLKTIDEYRIERCYDDQDTIRLKTEFIPTLSFEYIVSIAIEIDEREEIIGICKVINIKPNSYIELEIIKKNDNPIWNKIRMNDRSALDKSYTYPLSKLMR